MNRAELERAWAVTRNHLESACRQLPKESPSDEVAQRRVRYREWLDQNELGLALEELIFIGDELVANGLQLPAGVWSELAAAASNMQLEQKAASCRQKELAK